MIERVVISIFLMSVLLCSACSTVIMAPDVSAPTQSQAQRAWSDVLTDVVDDTGRVDFGSLQRNPERLERYVSYVSSFDPRMLANSEERLAYYLNSYNALAMYGVVQKGVPEDFDSTFKRLRFFLLTKFIVGGEEVSLYSYENDRIRALGEPRVHFALNCMSVGCPRLPRVPFEAAILDEQLEQAAVEFFESDKYVVVNNEKREVALSEILDFFTEDFVNPEQASSLIEFVNRFRQSPIPVDYKVTFIPYDWRINAQEA